VVGSFESTPDAITHVGQLSPDEVHGLHARLGLSLAERDARLERGDCPFAVGGERPRLDLSAKFECPLVGRFGEVRIAESVRIAEGDGDSFQRGMAEQVGAEALGGVGCLDNGDDLFVPVARDLLDEDIDVGVDVCTVDLPPMVASCSDELADAMPSPGARGLDVPGFGATGKERLIAEIEETRVGG
jgi:hypothetical protein